MASSGFRRVETIMPSLGGDAGFGTSDHPLSDSGGAG
jgi:hypothetical protein